MQKNILYKTPLNSRKIALYKNKFIISLNFIENLKMVNLDHIVFNYFMIFIIYCN